MGARENECQISQNYIFHMKLSGIYLCFHNSCEIWHSLSRTPMRNFLWCYYRWLITSLGLKNVKKNAIFCKLFWLAQNFSPLRIKIIQFPGGFRLNFRDLTTIILDTHLTFLTRKKEECFIREWRFKETVKLRRTLAVARFLCLSPFISLGKVP